MTIVLLRCITRFELVIVNSDFVGEVIGFITAPIATKTTAAWVTFKVPNMADKTEPVPDKVCAACVFADVPFANNAP
jgi:hypothetical protein